jgi:hypothetical protein
MPVMADPGIQRTGPDALAVQNMPGRSPRGYPGRRMVVPIPDAEDSLVSAGYEVTDVRGAPDRPGLEWVFIARKPVPAS